ncbi:hypothetical protein ACN20G_19190 [Streptomyces sp. BI20]|uniref:hypothetical protein n=1 Tax=Streptomyces sp. BI20 TaxID=3403460 RepID=UPI003C791DFF
MRDEEEFDSPALPAPRPVVGCGECAGFEARRVVAARGFDHSAVTDARVLLRRHLDAAHAEQPTVAMTIRVSRDSGRTWGPTVVHPSDPRQGPPPVRAVAAPCACGSCDPELVRRAEDAGLRASGAGGGAAT